MGRDTSITLEQVSAVAARLQAAGEKPTARAVRATLGAGSMATVVKHLQSWRSDQKSVEGPSSLPPAVQRAILDCVASEVALARHNALAELEEAHQAHTDLIAEVEQHQATVELLTKEKAVLQDEKSTHVGRCQQLELGIAQLREEAQKRQAEFDSAIGENARLAVRLEHVSRLEADIDRMRANFELEHIARVAAEQEAAVMYARFEALEQRLNELLARHSSNR